MFLNKLTGLYIYVQSTIWRRSGLQEEYKHLLQNHFLHFLENNCAVNESFVSSHILCMNRPDSGHSFISMTQDLKDYFKFQ